MANKNTPDNTAYGQLRNAVKSGNLPEVTTLHGQYNFDFNFIHEEDYGQTLLHFANCEITAYLLSVGADPNIPDRSGRLPFHYLIYHGRLDYLDLFLPYSMNLNLLDPNRRTSLNLFLEYCYGNLAWKGIGLKKQCLAIAEAMIVKGAAYEAGYDSLWVRELTDLRKLFIKHYGVIF